MAATEPRKDSRKSRESDGLRKAPPLLPRPTRISPKPSSRKAWSTMAISSLITVLETSNCSDISVNEICFDGFIRKREAILINLSVLELFIIPSPQLQEFSD